ncbi:unnamed protein product [Prorocentrum cordatum]|uniref:OTU domain-containing protein n=1 Tax=Prorocentrum cordatum TaxID=2364126 RepID=A0ABN9QB88_9DINO|nr:unnamed protein product [Polarella glacialis]
MDGPHGAILPGLRQPPTPPRARPAVRSEDAAAGARGAFPQPRHPDRDDLWQSQLAENKMPGGARRSYGVEEAYPSWSFGHMVGLVGQGAGAPAAAAPPAEAAASGSRARCDKCDGAHETERCPHFKCARDQHPDDAWQQYSGAPPDRAQASRQCGAPRALPRHAASVVRMPGDGSCLFHSVAFGLRAAGYQEDGRSVRARAANFIRGSRRTRSFRSLGRRCGTGSTGTRRRLCGNTRTVSRPADSGAGPSRWPPAPRFLRSTLRSTRRIIAASAASRTS